MKHFRAFGLGLWFFVSASVSAGTYYEGFASYVAGAAGTQCWLSDGARFGDWSLVFGGYGSACVVKTAPSQAWLRLAPQAPVTATETHSALVAGRTVTQPFTYSVTVRTSSQLRQNFPPNPWEVAWVIWDYAPVGNSSRFYYFMLKPNGWEFGQFNAGVQRFIRTGAFPVATLNGWYTFTVTQKAASWACRGAPLTLSVKIGSSSYPLASFCDTIKPYSSGAIGFYVEDAIADYTNVYVVTP